MISFKQYILEEEEDREVYGPGHWRKLPPAELERFVDIILQNRDPSFVDVLVASDIIPKPAPEGWDPQLWYQLQIWGIFDQTVDTPEEEPEEVKPTQPTPIEGGGTRPSRLTHFFDKHGDEVLTTEPTDDPNDPRNQPPPATPAIEESFQHTSNSPFAPPDELLIPRSMDCRQAGTGGI